MHRSLGIPEVVHMIFAHLASGDSATPANRAALGRLAIACRSFTNPALDILWHDQAGLGPLLNCLHTTVLDSELEDELWVTAIAVAELESGSQSVIKATDWDRVRFYAPRVKSITLDTLDTPQWGVSADVLELLSMSPPFEWLLPNLAHLSWDTNDPVFFPYIRLFLGPKITSINITLDGPAARLAILPMLASRYPSLSGFELVMNEGFKAHRHLRIDATSSMIRALTVVQSLSVQYLEPAVCRHLASLDSLTSLSVCVGDWLFTDELTQSTEPMFSSLRVLELRESRSDLCTEFIGMLSYPLLSRLTISTNGPPTEDEALALFSTIYHRFPHPTLTVLDVHLGRCVRGVVTSSVDTIPSAALQPLLAFSNLSKVAISVPFLLSLDDAFVEEMAMAWPRLEELALTRSQREVPTPSSVTVPALAAFARHCPTLSTLTIPVSGGFPPDWDHARRPSDTQQALSLLDVLDSPITAPIPVAAYLSCVFPNISLIKWDGFLEYWDDGYYEPPPSVHEKRWEMVKELITVFATVRAQEESHWRGE
ncbi:hypothetical protein FB451DRAFT_1554194 [Mycena latifolia]|nr:hypothetical protein FB451DRAFT_1554194 [Mycena latifolia]